MTHRLNAHYLEVKRRMAEGLYVQPGAVREYLLRSRGHQCEQCKLKEWLDQLIPLDSHHEDGNYENNREENLKLLCKNCHGLTPNFGRKNKLGSREYRRKYRKTGSSI